MTGPKQYIYSILFVSFGVFLSHIGMSQTGNHVALKNQYLELDWEKNAKGGYFLSSFQLKRGNSQKLTLPIAQTQRTVLYTKDRPSDEPLALSDKNGGLISFPDTQYRYVIPNWKEATSAVSLNRAGEAHVYFPSLVEYDANAVRFFEKGELFEVEERWSLDSLFIHDIHVTIILTAKQRGYYSIATPSLVRAEPDDFQWAMIPGIFQGKSINSDFVQAYAYGHGIPDIPVIVRERTTSTLAPLLTLNSGVTIATIADPGYARDPWPKDKNAHAAWRLGLSIMNRHSELTPTLYYPVLGQEHSFMDKGEKRSFSFRYSIQDQDWYKTLQHVINNIYRFPDFLDLKNASSSLSDRIYTMYDYVLDDSISKWEIEAYEDTDIGAQNYLGGVYGAQKDAMKNSDYGAMWMLAYLTENHKLLKERLPYAAAFKSMQQQKKGFFSGAAAGQYYLSKSKQFTEEWGPYVEPIGTTYYMMMDIGNILLFEPHRTDLQDELHHAADWLLHTMKDNGQWTVAYDSHSQLSIFNDLEDLRPTFYGLLVAYKLLGDQKYKEAALKSADWYIQNAVERGWFLGVCGDTRFAPDFATVQSAQALLDMYDVTKEKRFKDAACQVARYYISSIYTHPIPSLMKKNIRGNERMDWEVSQVGLSFEHGGIIGSANHHGPILLASHAGFFVRIFSETNDKIFLDMARAAAWGRHAFVDDATGVASYYWDAMNKGAGPYPHHAWWQIGWITDYLISEATLRTQGRIDFPRGFITPKVGPHQSYGFAKGNVFESKVQLILHKGLVSIDNPNIEYLTAADEKQKALYLILLNNNMAEQEASIDLDPARFINEHGYQGVRKSQLFDEKGHKLTQINKTSSISIQLPSTGLRVLRIDFE